MTPAVLALVCQQAAQDEAWAAWLADVPMSWLVGTPAPVAPLVRKSRRFKFSRPQRFAQ